MGILRILPSVAASLFIVSALAEFKTSLADEPAKPYWAYQPLTGIAPPGVKDKSWSKNAIDLFVLQKLEAHNLAPNSPADRVVLIRRIFYDLTGLPPTPEEVDAFVADSAPDAYERWIDRLLSSPRYGEKWGRH